MTAFLGCSIGEVRRPTPGNYKNANFSSKMTSSIGIHGEQAVAPCNWRVDHVGLAGSIRDLMNSVGVKRAHTVRNLYISERSLDLATNISPTGQRTNAGRAPMKRGSSWRAIRSTEYGNRHATRHVEKGKTGVARHDSGTVFFGSRGRTNVLRGAAVARRELIRRPSYSRRR